MLLALMRRRPATKGFILLTVLWMGLGLLLAASSYLATQRQEALSIRAEVETSRAVELARSGVNIALSDLSIIKEGAPRSPRDGSPVRVAMAEGTATYSIQDEGGKLSVSKAPLQLLQPALERLSQGSGRDAFDAASVAQAILANQRERGPPKPLAQLLAEIGLPERISLRARSILSNYNGANSINPRTAPVELLEAIPGIGRNDISEIVARRQTGRAMPRLGTAANFLAELEGPVYTIRSTGTLTSGASATVVGIVAARGISFRGGVMEFDILSVDIIR